MGLSFVQGFRENRPEEERPPARSANHPARRNVPTFEIEGNEFSTKRGASAVYAAYVVNADNTR